MNGSCFNSVRASCFNRKGTAGKTTQKNNIMTAQSSSSHSKTAIALSRPFPSRYCGTRVLQCDETQYHETQYHATEPNHGSDQSTGAKLVQLLRPGRHSGRLKDLIHSVQANRCAKELKVHHLQRVQGRPQDRSQSAIHTQHCPANSSQQQAS